MEMTLHGSRPVLIEWTRRPARPAHAIIAFAVITALSACTSAPQTGSAPVDGWYDFSKWDQCRSMERPGYSFEIENAEGMKLWTPCTPVVELPFDWKSEPQRFRLVKMVQGEHSTPMTPPSNR